MSPGSRGLDERVRAVRRHLDGLTWRAVAAWSAGGLVGILVLAWLLAGPEGWRQGSDVPLLLVSVSLAALLLGAVAVWRAARGWYREVPLTRAMEMAAGLEEGSVRGPLELGRAVPEGVSASLAGRAAESTLEALRGSESELAGPLGLRARGWIRKGTGVLVAGVVVAVTLAVLAPERAASAWSGLVRPLAIAVDPVLPALQVWPGSVEVRRGEPLEVRIEAPGRSAVRLSWQEAGEVARTRELPLQEGEVRHRFAAVDAETEYRVQAPDGAEAGPFSVTPVDPLLVSDLRVRVAHPPHTGMPAEEYRGEVPPLSLPAGSRLTIEGRTNRSLGRAFLERRDSTGAPVGEAVAFTLDGPSFGGGWTPSRSGIFAWALRDPEGAEAEVAPQPLEITLVPDRAPSIAIPVPGRDTVLPVQLRQPLVLEARDDYGLRTVELVAYRVSSVGERDEPRVRTLSLEGTRAAVARPVLDLTGWGLLPGDTVRYFARAVDNAPSAQTARTPEYLLRMPDAAAMRREAERRIGEVGERLEELARQAGEQADETRDMERAARGAPQEEERAPPPGTAQPPDRLGFEEREEMRRAIQGQEELTGQVDSLQSELEQLQEAMTEAGQADPELSDDLEELQRLLDEVADGEMRERMEELSESVEEDRVRDSQEALEEMAEEQEAFRERLEQSLERFRRAAVDQDFRATRSEAEELAREEEALADAMEEGDEPALRAEQQEALAERTDELQERMDRLEERLEELGEDDAAREVETAREQAAEARSEMARAGEQARQEQSGAEQAREAAGRMQETGEQLSEAQQQMAAEQARVAQEALRSVADEALALARNQQTLQEGMEGAGREELVGMRGDQASLIQGVQNMAQSLQDAGESAGGTSQELATQMGRAMQALERTVEAMGGTRGAAQSPGTAADQAVASLNQLALMALAGAEQMSQNQQGQGQSSPQQVGEQLQELAQQQGQVNNQSSQLTPMQLGEQALRQQMERLAQEQQSVAERLEELSEEPTTQEEALGDVQELAREAQALAREMAGGGTPQDLRERQENLFRRLLDSGRSLEREEYSDERESTGAGDFDAAEVEALTEDELGALRYRIPSAEELQRLPPAVRQLVLQYFERLNRGAERPGGGP